MQWGISRDVFAVCLRCRMMGTGSGTLPVLRTAKAASKRAQVQDQRRGISSENSSGGRWKLVAAGRTKEQGGNRAIAYAARSIMTEGAETLTAASLTSHSGTSGATGTENAGGVGMGGCGERNSTAAFAGLKRSENWDEGWFVGNHRAFDGFNGILPETSLKQSMRGTQVKVQGKGGSEAEKTPENEGEATRDEQQAGKETNDQKPETYVRKPLYNDYEPPDERTVNLGKTIRTLQSSLPTILQSPLPSELLSPQITLHLFPSSHPHLPTARGRVAYKTALWTSPFVWGQIPGRVRLEILAERVVKPCEHGEELRVRWRTLPTSNNFIHGVSTKSSSVGSSGGSTSSQGSTGAETLEGGATGGTIFSANKSESGGGFTGLFIFTFDEQGRILTHIIEHADEGWREEEVGYMGAGAKIISVAEWLLKKARQGGGGAEGGKEPGLVFVREVQEGRGRGRGMGRV
ncbi:hypothetical protein BDZ91DRAFT_103743 [Kalaharituber pfeilii]|nr:hypothetical protein BDZ91DRAFT_103743 [Kalaharituber pfeilii]